jgi:hypothetical protein
MLKDFFADPDSFSISPSAQSIGLTDANGTAAVEASLSEMDESATAIAGFSSL